MRYYYRAETKSDGYTLEYTYAIYDRNTNDKMGDSFTYEYAVKIVDALNSKSQ